MSHYLSIQAYKSQYDAIINNEEDAKVRTLWLHLMALYFPNDKGFGLLFQDWPCDGSLDFSIIYLAPCKSDTRDLRHQPKNMFVLTIEKGLHEKEPDRMDYILDKFAKKIRKLTVKGQEGQTLCAAVASGTHVRFFWLEPGHEKLTEGNFGDHLELSEHERSVNLVLDLLSYDLVGEWEL